MVDLLVERGGAKCAPCIARKKSRFSALKADLDSGRPEAALHRWLPAYDGLHLYYPSRCQIPPKLRVFIDFLKQRMG